MLNQEAFVATGTHVSGAGEGAGALDWLLLLLLWLKAECVWHVKVVPCRLIVKGDGMLESRTVHGGLLPLEMSEGLKKGLGIVRLNGGSLLLFEVSEKQEE